MASAFLTLEDEDVKILLTTYQQRQKDIQAKLHALQQEKKKIEEKILALTRRSTSNPFNREWTWNEKIAYAFENSILGPSLSASEIVEEIMHEQPELDRTLAMRSISATLTVGADKGKYRKIIKEGQDMRYEIIKS